MPDNETPTTDIRVCAECGDRVEIKTTFEALARRAGGAKVQDAFPDLPAPLREMYISGTCPACWKRIMAEPELDGDGDLTPAQQAEARARAGERFDVFGTPPAAAPGDRDQLLATDCDDRKLARVRWMAKTKGWTITRIIALGGPLNEFGGYAIQQ